MRTLHFQILAFFAFMIIATNLFADSNVIKITEGGATNTYEIALDHVYIPTKGIKSIDAQKSADSLKELAESIMTTAKESVFLVLYPPGTPQTEKNRRIVTDEILLEASPSGAAQVTHMEGVQRVESLDFAPGFYRVVVANPMLTLSTAERIRTVPGVKTSEAQIASTRVPQAVPNDFFYGTQWHLKNNGQAGGTPGIDVNVETVWNTIRGTGQVIGILDTGVDILHEDLASSINSSLSYDFNDTDTNPTPVVADGSASYHGTACAGVAAAKGFNSKGVSGVAPAAKIAAIRLISAPITDIVEASAMAFKNTNIGIKSNSWKPALTLGAPGTLTKNAFQTAVTSGRGGKGTIFLFAGGNGSQSGENSNYNGYANSIYTIAVAAISDLGTQASYSEPGANLVIGAPSSSAMRQSITTTDITGPNGYNNADGSANEPANTNYTSTFGGTSSACPAVAGVVALMLEAKPQLTWRDVQNILIRSAKQNNPNDSDWIINGAGLHFNHKFGAGLVDAEAAVALAKSSPLLAASTITTADATGLPQPIPDQDPTGISLAIPVTSNIQSLEHVVVEVSALHSYRGDLKIEVISPSSTSSILAEPHGDNGINYTAWPFMTVRNWGENPNGTWTVKIADIIGIDLGVVTAVKLKLYGTATAGAPPSPTPTPVPNTDVICTIVSPPQDTITSARTVKVTGTASSAAGIARVEYRQGAFGALVSSHTPTTSNAGFATIQTDYQPPSSFIPPYGIGFSSSSISSGGSYAPPSINNKWIKALGTTSWRFQVPVKRGQAIFSVRAVNKNGAFSDIQTLKILVR